MDRRLPSMDIRLFHGWKGFPSPPPYISSRFLLPMAGAIDGWRPPLMDSGDFQEFCSGVGGCLILLTLGTLLYYRTITTTQFYQTLCRSLSPSSITWLALSTTYHLYYLIGDTLLLQYLDPTSGMSEMPS